ncbi:MAG: hypothetical protein SCH98_10915 [Deferrisomatales bacterium]|nr:hypothetical protein [Deferrisomatales bacterium]
MELGESVRRVLQELVLPELGALRGDNAEIKTALQLTNKRLDDINLHLVDQSRRIDELRAELLGRIEDVRADLTGRIDATNQRIDATNQRIDELRTELVGRIDATSQRIDELRTELVGRIDATNQRIDEVRTELTGRVEDVRADLTGRVEGLRGELTGRIDELNRRIDRFFEEGLAQRVARLEKDFSELRARVAA